MGHKIVITENEKRTIKQLYNLNEQEYIFDTPHITIDGRYVIYNDELYDYTVNENLGNLFCVKNLKFLFENISPEILNNDIQLIENVKTEISKINNNEKLMMESVKHSIKNNLILEQNKFAENVIGKGVLYIARTVKKYLWTIGGIALDTFLVASGIGKSVQWIPWGVCLGLDIYEWSTGDYGNPEDKESSTFWKLLTIGFDIMGMMSAGPVAKAASMIMKPFKALKTETEIAKLLGSSPKALKIVVYLKNIVMQVSKQFEQLVLYIGQKVPKLGEWLNSLTQSLNKFLSWMSGILGKILKNPEISMQKGLKSAGSTAAVVSGIDYSVKKIVKNPYDDILNANRRIKVDYSTVDV